MCYAFTAKMQEETTTPKPGDDPLSVDTQRGSSASSEHGEDAGPRKRSASVSSDQRPAKALKSIEGGEASRQESVATESEAMESEASGKQGKMIEDLKAELQELRQAKEKNVKVYLQKIKEVRVENNELQSEKADLQIELKQLKKSRSDGSKEKINQMTANLNETNERKLSAQRESHDAIVQDMKARYNKRVRELRDDAAAAEEEAKEAKAELLQREKEIKKEKIDFKRELRQEQQAEIKKYKPETSTELKEKKKAIDEHVKREKAYQEQIKKSGEEIGELRATIENLHKSKHNAGQRIKGLQECIKLKEDFIQEIGSQYGQKLKFEGDRWAKLQECHAQTKVMLTAQQRANFLLRTGNDSLASKNANLVAEVMRLRSALAATGQGSATAGSGGNGGEQVSVKGKDENGDDARKIDATVEEARSNKGETSHTAKSSTPLENNETQAPPSLFDGKASLSTEKADTPMSEGAAMVEEFHDAEFAQPSTSFEQATVDATPVSEEADTPMYETPNPKDVQSSTSSGKDLSSEAMGVDADDGTHKHASALTFQRDSTAQGTGEAGGDTESGRPIWARRAAGFRDESLSDETMGWSAPSEESESVRVGSDDMDIEG